MSYGDHHIQELYTFCHHRVIATNRPLNVKSAIYWLWEDWKLQHLHRLGWLLIGFQLHMDCCNWVWFVVVWWIGCSSNESTCIVLICYCCGQNAAALGRVCMGVNHFESCWSLTYNKHFLWNIWFMQRIFISLFSFSLVSLFSSLLLLCCVVEWFLPWYTQSFMPLTRQMKSLSINQ